MVEQGHQPESSCRLLLPLDSPELQGLSRHFPGVGVGVGWAGAHGGGGRGRALSASWDKAAGRCREELG